MRFEFLNFPNKILLSPYPCEIDFVKIFVPKDIKGIYLANFLNKFRNSGHFDFVTKPHIYAISIPPGYTSNMLCPLFIKDSHFEQDKANTLHIYFWKKSQKGYI